MDFSGIKPKRISPDLNNHVAEPGSQMERLENELTAILTAFVDGNMSLHELRATLIDYPAASHDVSRKLVALYATSRTRLVMFDHGDFTQEELRESIRAILHVANSGEFLEDSDPMSDPSRQSHLLVRLDSRPIEPEER